MKDHRRYTIIDIGSGLAIGVLKRRSGKRRHRKPDALERMIKRGRRAKGDRRGERS